MVIFDNPAAVGPAEKHIVPRRIREALEEAPHARNPARPAVL